MLFYHISCKDYNDGDVLTGRSSPSGFHLRSVENGTSWINNILEKGAPANAPIRSRAYFAFENLGSCIYYWSKTNCGGAGPYIYEVVLTNSVSAPMVLTDLIREVGQDYPHIDQLVNEYWNRQKSWKFIEHLGDMMTVVRKIEPIDQRLKIQARDIYIDDIQLRKQLKQELENV